MTTPDLLKIAANLPLHDPARASMEYAANRIAALEEVLTECLDEWGCECPYCDRDFGTGFDGHSLVCKAANLLQKTVDASKQT